MAEYQKFIFNDNYSTEPENLEKIKQKKMLDAQTLMAPALEEAKKQAYEEGFQAGQKMALEKLKAEMELHINSLAENIGKINEYKPELKAIYEQHSTSCVNHIANNMFFKSEELFSEQLLNQAVENALTNLPFVSQINIKVPSGCKAYLEDTKVEEKIRSRGVSDFIITEDPTILQGQCRIEWDKSGILSSKVESFEKINTTFAAFLTPEDLELSKNTKNLAPVEETTPEEAEIAIEEPAPERPEESAEDIEDIIEEATEEPIIKSEEKTVQEAV